MYHLLHKLTSSQSTVVTFQSCDTRVSKDTMLELYINANKLGRLTPCTMIKLVLLYISITMVISIYKACYVS